MRRGRAAAGLAAALALCAMMPADAAEPLRVCADPNNMPFSREDGAGFENALARLVADELGRPLAYVWWAQRRGFVRNTLKAGSCDLIVGVPAHGYGMVARTSPYYRSTYVAVTRADRHLAITSLEDPRLKDLRIGVQLIGDDGMNTPPAHALASLGIVGKVVGFPVYGDYRTEAPPQRIVDAVAAGTIDVAFAWGAMAGPVARASAVPLDVSPLEDTDRFAPIRFSFEIAMGVRRDDLALRRTLEGVLVRRAGDIDAILDGAGVPRLPFVHPVVEDVRP